MAFDATRAPKQSEETKQWSLRAEEELRLEIDADSLVLVTLISGTAEILGHELSSSIDTPLTGVKTVIVTWHGCQLSVKGQVQNAYVQGETPMISYLNTHAAIEELRQTRKKSGSGERGPVALIVGPIDSGKSSLARMLCNYAVRARHQPLFADVDVQLNQLSVPGTLACTNVQATIAPEACDYVSVKAPLIYFYGHLQPTQLDLYKQLLERLASTMQKRFAINEISRSSGAIINTGAWTESQTGTSSNLDLIVFMCHTFQVDVLIVIGHDRLYNDLKAEPRLHSKDSPVTVCKLAKSGGVISRNAAMRSTLRSQIIREYFYGPQRDLRPHTKMCAFKDISIFRIGSGPLAPASTLPIGQSRLLDPNAVVKVQPTLELLHSVMAISYALDMSQVLSANVAGFCFVTNVDMAKRTITVLCPAPGALPSTCFILGSIKWHD